MAAKKESKISDRKSKKTKEQEKTEAELAEELAKQPPPEPTEGSGLFEFANGAKYHGDWKMAAPTPAQVQAAADSGSGKPAVSGKKLRHGRGTFTWNGDTYSGDWTEDAMTGRGVYRFSSGAVYDGALINGRFNGDGRYQFPSGAQYMGQWVENRMHGEGCFLTADGSRYRGTFHNDRFLQKDGASRPRLPPPFPSGSTTTALTDLLLCCLGSWIAPQDQTERRL